MLEPALVCLAQHLEDNRVPLGVEGLTLRDLVAGISYELPIASLRSAEDPNGRALDTFVEAQVHGAIDLGRDVEALVVDSSFFRTDVAETLDRLSHTYGIPLRWHPGFRLHADEFPDVFRGFPTRSVARRVASGGLVDARSLGAGQNHFLQNPRAWEDLGSRSDVLTSFRRVWHVLVLTGRPSPHWSDLSSRERTR